MFLYACTKELLQFKDFTGESHRKLLMHEILHIFPVLVRYLLHLGEQIPGVMRSIRFLILSYSVVCLV